MNKKYLFQQVVQSKKGFLRGPFGGDLKKEIFVEKSDTTYKVYEQGVVLNSDKNIGRYYISEEDYKAKLYKFSIQDKDFLVSCSGINMGAIYQLKAPFERGIINQALLRIRLNDEIIDDNYFKYLFKELISKKITSGSGDSTIPNFPGLDLIKNIEFELPTKNIQIKVGKLLYDLDSKIELNNRINAELEAMAKTLYDYWFVQFDFPNEDGKPYKSSGGKIVWNEELKREVPEGWKTEKMSEWVDIDKSGDWGKEEQEGNFTKKVVCFRGADINGLNGLAELKPPVRYILEKNSSKILKSHDLIIEISGGSPTQSTGRLAFITDATIKRFEYPLICSNFCKPISIRNKKLLYNFVYYWNSLYDNGIFFGYEGKTSGIKNLLLDSFLSSYSTVVPDEKVVNQFYDIMESIQEKKQTALAENQQLSSLRDWLLPMLMNGQVRPLAPKGEQEMEEWNGMMAAEPGVDYGK
jgi:type I restriction enzyme S subunit